MEQSILKKNYFNTHNSRYFWLTTLIIGIGGTIFEVAQFFALKSLKEIGIVLSFLTLLVSIHLLLLNNKKKISVEYPILSMEISISLMLYLINRYYLDFYNYYLLFTLGFITLIFSFFYPYRKSWYLTVFYLFFGATQFFTMGKMGFEIQIIIFIFSLVTLSLYLLLQKRFSFKIIEYEIAVIFIPLVLSSYGAFDGALNNYSVSSTWGIFIYLLTLGIILGFIFLYKDIKVSLLVFIISLLLGIFSILNTLITSSMYIVGIYSIVIVIAIFILRKLSVSYLRDNNLLQSFFRGVVNTFKVILTVSIGVFVYLFLQFTNIDGNYFYFAGFLTLIGVSILFGLVTKRDIRKFEEITFVSSLYYFTNFARINLDLPWFGAFIASIVLLFLGEKVSKSIFLKKANVILYSLFFSFAVVDVTNIPVGYLPLLILFVYTLQINYIYSREKIIEDLLFHLMILSLLAIVSDYSGLMLQLEDYSLFKLLKFAVSLGFAITLIHVKIIDLVPIGIREVIRFILITLLGINLGFSAIILLGIVSIQFFDTFSNWTSLSLIVLSAFTFGIFNSEVMLVEKIAAFLMLTIISLFSAKFIRPRDIERIEKNHQEVG